MLQVWNVVSDIKATAYVDPPIQRVPGVLSSGVKRPAREADHLPPSSAEVMDGGGIPSLPHTSPWRGV
jgi:hypothetical protein